MTDVAAAVEPLRAFAPDHVGAHPDQGLCPGCQFDAALATIEARIAEVERERDYFRDRLPDFSAVQQADFARAEAAEADLLLAAQQNTRLSERLDRLEGALRLITKTQVWVEVGKKGPSSIARAALAEEPYADIPGAGQRGC